MTLIWDARPCSCPRKTCCALALFFALGPSVQGKTAWTQLPDASEVPPPIIQGRPRRSRHFLYSLYNIHPRFLLKPGRTDGWFSSGALRHPVASSVARRVERRGWNSFHLAQEEIRWRAGLTKWLDVWIPVSTLDIPASRESSHTSTEKNVKCHMRNVVVALVRYFTLNDLNTRWLFCEVCPKKFVYWAWRPGVSRKISPLFQYSWKLCQALELLSNL